MRVITAIVFASLLWGCGNQTPKEIPPLPIPVVKVEQKQVPIEADFVGSVYGSVDIPVRARVDGYLKGIHFHEGDRVREGQLLYSIDAQPFEAAYSRAQSEVAQAETALVKTESDLNRIKPLAEIRAVSQAELDGAQANYDAAKSALEAAKQNARMARIELGYTKISSPINGVIGKSLANLGEYVGKSPNPVILNTISQTDSIHVEFFIPENDYLQIARYNILRRRSNQNSRAESWMLRLILSDNSMFEHEGRILFANREIDQNTGSLLIQTAFPNPDDLIKPGQFVKVRLIIVPNDQAVIIPQRTVKEFQGLYSVYIVKDDNTVTERYIDIQGTYRDYFIVRDGLEPGEQIVLEGLQKVREGGKIAPELVEFKSKMAEK